MKGKKISSYLLMVLLLAPALSSCKQVSINEIKQIEYNSLHQKYVKATLSYKTTKNGSSSTSKYVYERYVDKDKHVWVITPSDDGYYYSSRGYSCYYNPRSPGDISVNYDGIIDDTIHFDSLIDTYESVNDSNKKVIKSGRKYTLEFSFDKFIKMKYGNSAHALNKSDKLSIEFKTKKRLLTSGYFSYSVEMHSIGTAGITKTTEVINHNFTYDGKANIPEKVKKMINMLADNGSIVPKITAAGDEEYPLALPTSITNDKRHDIHYYNLANYEYNFDNYNGTVKREYFTYCDNEKYIIAIDNKKLYVYDLFTLKKLYTATFPLYVEQLSAYCSNGIIALRFKGSADGGASTGFYYYYLDDFTPILYLLDDHFEMRTLGDGCEFFVEYEGNVGIVNAYDFEAHTVTEIARGKLVNNNRLYYNFHDNRLAYIAIEASTQYPYIVVIDCDTYETLYEIEAPSEFKSSPNWTGRYFYSNGYLFDTKTGLLTESNTYSDTSLGEYEYVYGHLCSEEYDQVVFYNDAAERNNNYWMYDHVNDSLIINVPAYFQYNLRWISDNYYVSIVNEMIMTIRVN